MEEQISEVPTCYRHSKSETYVRCTRCDRYICPDCMRDAAVGHQCVECVREGNKSVRQARTVFGGKVSAVPVVTYALIVIIVLAYAGEIAMPSLVDRLDGLGIGLLGADGQYYVYESDTGLTPIGVAAGEWYRLITANFLHLQPTEGGFGILHIVFNLYWLWTLGRAVEEMLGRLRFVGLYLLAAVGSSVFEYLISPDTEAVGASGAIFGLAAAYFVFSRRLGHDPLGGGRLMMFFLIWLVISAGFTSWEGHLGGLIVGGATALALAYLPRKYHLAAMGAMLVLLAVLVAVKTHDLGLFWPSGSSLNQGDVEAYVRGLPGEVARQ
ncbi:rhomboid family intramembrane serine protease [Nonomuraea sp. NPDC048901]|uniref:rhomboid family intramembrane serine protease n=1 Tax=unclassified Nonomuraea TaxID=2593643 RepID=UPI0033D7041A